MKQQVLHTDLYSDDEIHMPRRKQQETCANGPNIAIAALIEARQKLPRIAGPSNGATETFTRGNFIAWVLTAQGELWWETIRPIERSETPCRSSSHIRVFQRCSLRSNC